MTTLATRRNMEEAASRGKRAVAFSPMTCEQYSATSGDYFMRGMDEPLLDAEGEPMVLVISTVHYIDALTAEHIWP